MKPDANGYARNQYRLGFALLNLKRVPEAKAALTDAASVNSPVQNVGAGQVEGNVRNHDCPGQVVVCRPPPFRIENAYVLHLIPWVGVWLE